MISFLLTSSCSVDQEFFLNSIYSIVNTFSDDQVLVTVDMIGHRQTVPSFTEFRTALVTPDGIGH